MPVRHLFAALLLLFLCGCFSRASNEPSQEENNNWQSRLDESLPALGHRNWILVVDKAYPAQTAPGVEVVNTGSELPDVLLHTLDRIGEAKHVTPHVYQDSELQYLNDSMAAGVGAFRAATSKHLDGLPRSFLSHDSLLKLTTAAGTQYRILVLKTETLLPYTSVFLQLDCGYWNPQQDSLLKARMPLRSHSDVSFRH